MSTSTMKNTNNYYGPFFFFSLILLLAIACEKPDDPEEQHNSLSTPNPDEISADFELTTTTVFQGSLGQPTMAADLQILGTEILITEGSETLVGILKPAELELETAHVQVVGSETIMEIPFEDSGTETLAHLRFSFDGSDWDLPLTFEVDIAPLDSMGIPIVIFATSFVVEEATQQDPDPDPGSFSIDDFVGAGDSTHYKWQMSFERGLHGATGSLFASLPGLDDYGIDPSEYGGYAEGTEIIYTQMINGCCFADGSSDDGDCIGQPTHAIVPGDTKIVVSGASLTFFRDGSVTGKLDNRMVQNVNPAEFDFCNAIPAYSISNVQNTYEGMYTYDAAEGSLKIDNLNGETEPVYSYGQYIGAWPLYIHAGHGSSSEYIKYSENEIIVIDKDVEGGGIQGFDIYSSL